MEVYCKSLETIETIDGRLSLIQLSKIHLQAMKSNFWARVKSPGASVKLLCTRLRVKNQGSLHIVYPNRFSNLLWTLLQNHEINRQNQNKWLVLALVNNNKPDLKFVYFSPYSHKVTCSVTFKNKYILYI